MQVKDIMISLILFSMVVGGIAVFSGSLTSGYGVSFSEDFSMYQNYTQTMNSTSENILSSIREASQEKNIISMVGYSILGGLNIMWEMTKIPAVLLSSTSQIIGGLQLPTEIGWLPAGITVIILIIIIFAIVKMIFKVEV